MVVQVTYAVTITTSPITNTAEISDDNADEFTDADGNPLSDKDSNPDSDSSNDVY